MPEKTGRDMEDEIEDEPVINANEISHQVLDGRYGEEGNEDVDANSSRGSAWPSENSRLTPLHSNYLMAMHS
jgi:hypothetical protein